jgi:hypothetical protein
MEFWGWMALVAVVLIASCWFIASQNKKLSEEMDETIAALPGFKAGQFIRDNQQAFLVEVGERRVAVVARVGDKMTSRVFPIAKIVSVAIYEDGNSITETVRSSQLGGALVGGLLAGGVGAVIGGLSSKTETRQTVRDISLRFVLDDTRNPLCDVRLLFQPNERDSHVYKQTMDVARKWHGIVSILIRRADAEAKARQTEPANSQKAVVKEVVEQSKAPALNSTSTSTPAVESVADEIRKLKGLMDEGLISAEQFQAQRDKLLRTG